MNDRFNILDFMVLNNEGGDGSYVSPIHGETSIENGMYSTKKKCTPDLLMQDIAVFHAVRTHHYNTIVTLNQEENVCRNDVSGILPGLKMRV